MPSNQAASLPLAALTLIGCLLVTLGLFAEGRTEIMALGVGSRQPERGLNRMRGSGQDRSVEERSDAQVIAASGADPGSTKPGSRSRPSTRIVGEHGKRSLAAIAGSGASTSLVEVMGRTIAVRAEELAAEAAADWWPRIVRRDPNYERYARATSGTDYAALIGPAIC